MHGELQLPQFVSVVSEVSQPLLALASQSPKLRLQLGEHRPAAHVVVPFELTQTVPQTPQLLLVLSDASQPLLAKPSQLPKPALHMIPQVLALHRGRPLLALHALLHAPQLVTLEARLISQPLVDRPSQSPQPALHMHVNDPLVLVHVLLIALPQPPLFVTHSSMSTQVTPLPL